MRATASLISVLLVAPAFSANAASWTDRFCERYAGSNYGGWWGRIIERRCANYNPQPAPNTKPTVSITAPGNGSKFTEGDRLRFSGSASDKEDGNMSGKISWRSSRDGSISSSAKLSVGTHTVTASVKDSAGASASDTISVTVAKAAPPPPAPNTAPSIAITSPSKSGSVEEGTRLNFAARATDKEDGNLNSKVTWRSSRDGQLGSSATLSVGKHTITASVKDSKGLSASAQVAMTVTELQLPNTAPSVTINKPGNKTNVEEGTRLTFSGTALDNEDGNLSNNIVWRSSRDGKISSSSILSVGSHTITASVNDSEGMSGSDQVSVTVAKATPSTVSVSLSWIVPDERENGDSLEMYELGGYDIQYKKVGASLYYSETVDDAQKSDHVIADLEPGEYEFKIAAFDNEGLYSDYAVRKFTVKKN